MPRPDKELSRRLCQTICPRYFGGLAAPSQYQLILKINKDFGESGMHRALEQYERFRSGGHGASPAGDGNKPQNRIAGRWELKRQAAEYVRKRTGIDLPVSVSVPIGFYQAVSGELGV